MVLSIINGILDFFAIFDNITISDIFPSGLARLSANNTDTFGSKTAFSTSDIFSVSTKITSQPNFLNVIENWVIVPPYNFF